MPEPRRPELRGTCQQAAQTLVESDPTLTLVRGWYLDAFWGACEHWWCVAADGTIHDPTVEQFPTGHLPDLREYRPYDGVYPCCGCGVPVSEVDDPSATGFCCGACYGSTVGFPIGRCEC